VIRVLGIVMQRELLISFRRRADLANPLFFFLIVVSLFPIGVTPDLNELSQMAPGVLWVAALLASLLSLDLLFRHDFEDGSLEQMLLSSIPPQLLVLCKALNHWLVTGLPLTILSPVLSIMLALPAQAIPLQMLTLALGTLTLSMLGGIGAAITVGLRKGGLLLTVLIMPLLVPVVIFGTSAVQAFINDSAWAAQLALLGAFCAGSIALSPWLTVTALRISVGE
jgi:heme exporter protein B